MPETARYTYHVAGDCLVCGACSSLAPGMIAMADPIAVITRQPETAHERKRMDAAMFNCPVMAIRRRAVRD